MRVPRFGPGAGRLPRDPRENVSSRRRCDEARRARRETAPIASGNGIESRRVRPLDFTL